MTDGEETTGRWGCLFRLLATGVTICVVAVAAVGGYGYMEYERMRVEDVVAPGETVTLDIPENTSWPGVVDRVGAAQLVDRPRLFDLWGRSTGLAEEVRAGTFYLEGPMDIRELADLLRRGGRAEEVVVRLGEGTTMFDKADRISEAGLVERDEFLEALYRPERHEAVPDDVESLEGYLYPDTYRLDKQMPADEIAARLVDRWDEIATPIFEAHGDSLEELGEEYDLDGHDVIILASLIERETGVERERDVIARVFYNRLDRGMLLQTDPTCVYGEEMYDRRPTPEACRDENNLYSTYVHHGLPPGPIATPTASSIAAALSPSEDPEAQNYLFFVSRADGSGRHYFSTNYRDHREAIERYLVDR